MQKCWRAWRLVPPISRTFTIRFASSLALDDPSKIRNIALLAHIDSGKTTLSESILHATSYLSNPGTVDTGSTTTDFLPAERERGITIQSACIPVRWKDWTFNLIDTPGHVDFGMEVESASRVIDGAVVLMDAVEGVEGQTIGVWRQLDRYNVPTRMIFLNKLDRPGASLGESLRAIVSNGLHHHPMLLTIPVASFDDRCYRSGERGIAGLVDLVNWNIWRWDEAGETVVKGLPHSREAFEPLEIFSASHPIIPEIFKAREALIDGLSLYSADFMDYFLSLPSSPSPYFSVPSTNVRSTLRELSLTKAVLPVVCGAALRHIGTEILLNFVGDLLASPVDDQGMMLEPSRGGGAQVLAWKVGWDKQRGWMTFVRVYSGTLSRQSSLFNTNSQQRERISKLVLPYADRLETVETLPFGSVGVILGLKHTRTGDTLVASAWTDRSPPQSTSLKSIQPPPAVISASVVPQSQSDVGPVKDALRALSRTDPSVRVTEDREEDQTLVHGLGALHLEIIEGRLHDEWGVQCQFGRRRVSYREVFGSSSGTVIKLNDRFEKEVAGKRVGATVEIEIRPLTPDEISSYEAPRHSREESESVATGDDWGPWGENIVLDNVSRRLPHPSELRADSPLLPFVTGLATGLSTSPHTTLPVSRAHIVVRGVAIDEGAPPACVTGAASSAIRRAIIEAGPGEVMEPHVHLKVETNAGHIGRVAGDLTEHGGEIVDLDANGDDLGGPLKSDAFRYFEDNAYCPPSWVTPSSTNWGLSTSPTVQTKRTIRAIAPLSRMLDYSSRLRAVSAGLGTFQMSLEGFRIVPEVRKLEILREIGR